jgi:hypothetical protein
MHGGRCDSSGSSGNEVTSEAQTKKIDCADIGISAPSAKLIWDGNRFLGLRDFGEICGKT